MESEWHRTAPRTKQLVSDVSVLRKLLDYLIRYDAFAFYYLLMKLQVASSEQTSPSLWYVQCVYVLLYLHIQLLIPCTVCVDMMIMGADQVDVRGGEPDLQKGQRARVQSGCSQESSTTTFCSYVRFTR